MIYGLVANWHVDKKNFPSVFNAAFAFLEDSDLDLPLNGWHPIDGDKLRVSLQELHTLGDADRRFEAHKKYLDIQILLAGREKHLYTPSLAGMEITEDKLRDGDVAYYSRPASHSSLILEPDHYAVYFPGEPHCPCGAVAPGGEDIRKIVFKILWEG